jgi:hypothetical protein
MALFWLDHHSFQTRQKWVLYGHWFAVFLGVEGCYSSTTIYDWCLCWAEVPRFFRPDAQWNRLIQEKLLLSIEETVK